MRKHILIVSGLVVLAAIAILAWIAWPDTARLNIADVQGQRPDITSPREQWIPTMNVAKAVGWPDGAKPTAGPGLSVAAYTTGLDHPRWLYRLPNGDILVA